MYFNSIYEFKWSPDERYLAFTQYNTLWILEIVTGKLRLLFEAVDILSEVTDLSFSPDSRYLIFRVLANDLGSTLEYVLYRLELEGSALSEIAQHVGHGLTAWSPMGNLIAFTNWGQELNVAHSDGSDVRRLSSYKISMEDQSFWSHDGETLYVCAATLDYKHHGIYKVDPHTMAISMFLPALILPHPQLSPDGKRLAILGNGDRLFIRNSDGTVINTNLNVSGRDEPQWFPDNNRLLVWIGGIHHDLVIVDIQDQSHSILKGPNWHQACLSPSGKEIAFLERDKAGILTRPVEKKRVRRLVGEKIPAIEPEQLHDYELPT